jgi:pimeloyl-ACP methyl ester carboxylesterase
MNAKKLFTLFMTSVGLLLTLPRNGFTQSQEENTCRIRNVILVHGAWADGASWSKVILPLENQGLQVVAVHLPLTSLADDAAAVKRAMAAHNGPVLLVGHSYGGAVITEAGNDPQVAGLVYIAAFAPDGGQSALEQGTAYPTPGTQSLVPDQSGFLTLSPQVVRTDFAPDVSEREQRILTATQGPTSVAALGGKVSAAAWRSKPTWFLIAAQDRMVSPDLERAEAEQMNAESITLPSSHVPMVSHPLTVTAFILRAVQSIGR